MPTTQVTEITSSVDAIAARTDSAGAAVSPDWAAEERRMDHETGFPGIVEPTNAYQVVAGAAATMNIVVGSGTAKTDLAYVQGDIGGQGMYLVRFDEVTVTIALDAADPSDPRFDNVYLVVYDNIYDSTSRSLPRLAVRKGDPAGDPPVPDPAWEAFLLLAEVTIPAAAPDILSATIVDKRINAGPMDHAPRHLVGGADPVSFLVPTGGILPYGGSSAPTDYLLCDGTSYTTASRAALFAVIGYVFGGSGANFNVPDMRQRFPIGKAVSGTGSTLGGAGGGIDHVHSGPSHIHTMGTHIHTMPTHIHTMPTHTHTQGITGSDGPHDVSVIGGTNDAFNPISSGHPVADAHTHTNPTTAARDPGDTNATDPGNTNTTDPGDTNAAGTANTGVSNPPFLSINYIIKD